MQNLKSWHNSTIYSSTKLLMSSSASAAMRHHSKRRSLLLRRAFMALSFIPSCGHWTSILKNRLSLIIYVPQSSSIDPVHPCLRSDTLTQFITCTLHQKDHHFIFWGVCTCLEFLSYFANDVSSYVSQCILLFISERTSRWLVIMLRDFHYWIPYWFE